MAARQPRLSALSAAALPSAFPRLLRALPVARIPIIAPLVLALLLTTGVVAQDTQPTEISLPELELRALAKLKDNPSRVEPYIELAAVSDRRGELQVARGYLLRALALEPRRAAINHLLAVNYARTEQWEQAFEHFEKALRAEPKNAAMRYNYGNLLFDTRQYQLAAKQLHLALQLDPGNQQFQFSYAAALEANGQPEEALAEYTRLLETHPQEPRAYARRALLLLARGDSTKAAEDANAAVSLDADSLEALYVLGRVSEANSSLTDAVDRYNQVLDADPNHAEAHYRLASLYRRLGRDEDARRHVSLHHEITSRREAQEAVFRGRNALDGENFAFAELQFREALKADPANPDAAYLLGVAQQRQGKLDQAAGAFEKLLARTPDSAAAHASLGQVLLDGGQNAAAAAHLSQAAKLSVEDFDVSLAVGQGFTRLEQFETAEKSLLRAAALWPSHPRGMAALFELYVFWDKTNKAREYALLTEETNQDDGQLQYLVGLFWSAEQQLARAERALARAARLRPGDEKVSNLLSQIRSLAAKTEGNE